MRSAPAPVVCLLAACAACVVIAAHADPAEARPTVAIAGVEVAGDSVGVDVEAVGIARELTQALRRAADRPDGPLQLVDPMVRADDVEALVWGKLLRDGDGWVVTVHLSAVGADGDTVSYRATLTAAKTSSIELGRWGAILYDSLLDQVELEPTKDEPKPAPGSQPTVATGRSKNPFDVRNPIPGEAGAGGDGDPDTGDVFADRDATGAGGAGVTEPELQFRHDHDVPPDPAPHGNARRLFWISAGVAAAGAAFWTYAAFRISDAEDQIERIAGCTGCERAIEAANAQGRRWEGLSWLAGTATVAGVAAAVLFGYQGYIVGRRPAPSELIGAHPGRGRGRAVQLAPAIGPDRIGASVAVTF